MQWEKVKEPSFMVTAAVGVLLVVALIVQTIGMAELRTDLADLRATLASQTDEFEEAIASTDRYLAASDFGSAFDMLLVASRLAPSNPRLFDSAMKFIELGKASNDEEVVAMVDDLLDRSESLVHFQSPSAVQTARKRLTDLRGNIAPADPVVQSPFDSVRSLLAVSENAAVPLDVRLNAIQQARSNFDDTVLTLALPPGATEAAPHSEEIPELQSRMEQAERKCITESFQQSKARADAWLKNATSLREEGDKVATEGIVVFRKKVPSIVSQGTDHLQEITPFVKSSEAGATELSKAIEGQVEYLQRLNVWLYNKHVLSTIQQVEASDELDNEGKIRSLAEVDEEQLSAYVLRRYNTLWDTVFDDLDDDEWKAWALRLRILRVRG